MIYGIGVDIVRIERLREAYRKWGIRFFQRFLTDREIDYCFNRKEPYPSIAVRFAAKEALIKALSAGSIINMKDIEILNQENGRPVMYIHGDLENTLKEKGIKNWHLSMSHEREYGVSVVVLEI